MRNAVDNSRKFGASIGALGALAGAAIALRKGLQWLNEAAEQAAQKLQDFAGKGNDMLDERRQRSMTLNDLPRLLRERETLVKQLETQRQNVMSAGNNLPSTFWGSAWDKAKGWGFMNDWFGTESAAQDYDFES